MSNIVDSMADDREQLIILLDKATRYASLLDKASDGVQFRRAQISRKTDYLISPAEGWLSWHLVHKPTHQEVKDTPRTINCTEVLPLNVFITGEPIIVAWHPALNGKGICEGLALNQTARMDTPSFDDRLRDM